MIAVPETVVVVSDFAKINGGGAKVAIDSATLLANAGTKVIFFAGSGAEDVSFSHPNITVVCLDQQDIKSNPNRVQAMTTGIWNATAAAQLRSLLRDLDPFRTIVHVHSFVKVLSPSIGRVLSKCGLRVVFTMHDYFLACPNGGFYDYQKNEICNRKPLGMDCLTTNCDVRRPAHKVWRVIRLAAMKTAGKFPSGLLDIIYISETQKRAIVPYLPDHARLHHLPNPVSLPDVAPKRAVDNDTFVFVGRLSPEKGGLTFAHAAALAGVKATIVGDGPQAEQIRQGFPQAQILGWQSPASVAKQISKARCLVFSSHWYECQPLVPIEALGLGVPVICGDWTAASENVVNGKTGIVVSDPSPAAFSEAMKSLTDNSNPIFETTEEASKTVRNLDEQHLTGLLEIYQRILALP